MKKAKLMLTAIGVFAIVGSALALTVRTGERVYCYDSTLPPAGNQCEIISDATLTPGTTFQFTDLCSSDPNIDCSTITTPVNVYESL